MVQLKANRKNRMAILLLVCAASALLGFALGDTKVNTARANKSLSSQQSDEKVIVTAEHTDDPLKFGDLLHLKNVKIVMGRKFSAKSIAERGGGRVEDWLEYLEFSLKNISDKQITYIHLELQFPDTDLNGPPMVYRQLAIGIPPKPSKNVSLYRKPLALKSGDTLTFTLSDKDLQQIKDFLALGKFQLADTNKVVVQVLYLIFDDGIKWTLGGSYYRPNPSVPGGYERINQ
jgi:hypothetical protein